MADVRRAVERHPWPTCTAIGVAAAFAVAHLARSSPRVVAYLVVFFVVGWLVARVDREDRLGGTAWWGFALLTGLHLAGGLLPSPGGAEVFYETWLLEHTVKYDQAVHFYGTGLVAYSLWRLRGGRRLRWAWLGALAVGVANEVVEAGLARSLPTHVGDLENATWDLVFNLAGASAVVVALAVAGSDRHQAVGR